MPETGHHEKCPLLFELSAVIKKKKRRSDKITFSTIYFCIEYRRKSIVWKCFVTSTGGF
jgi:hypothetical protein